MAVPSKVIWPTHQAYKDGAQIICNEGGSRCFAPDTNVLTDSGYKKISELTENELVETPFGLKPIIAIHKMQNIKKSVRIKMKSGKVIECTEDHLFFYQQRWIMIKDLLSLLDKKNTQF